MNPTFAMVLALPLTYTAEEIVQSGLGRVLAEAEERRDGLVANTAEMLKELGITAEEIRRMVDEHLKREVVP